MPDVKAPRARKGDLAACLVNRSYTAAGGHRTEWLEYRFGTVERATREGLVREILTPNGSIERPDPPGSRVVVQPASGLCDTPTAVAAVVDSATRDRPPRTLDELKAVFSPWTTAPTVDQWTNHQGWTVGGVHNVVERSSGGLTAAVQLGDGVTRVLHTDVTTDATRTVLVDLVRLAFINGKEPKS